MEKPRLFCLGDSFCEYDATWIRQVRERYNLDLGSLGTGGSSLHFLVDQVYKLTKLHTLKPEDCIIVCITSANRFYSRGRHFGTWVGSSILDPLASTYSSKSYLLETNSIEATHKDQGSFERKKTVEAYLTWLYELSCPIAESLQGISIISHIFSNIIPTLGTKRIAVFHNFSNEDNCYTDERVRYTPVFNTSLPPLKDFLLDYYGSSWNESLTQAPNHIDTDDDLTLREVFFKTYGSYIEQCFNQR